MPAGHRNAIRAEHVRGRGTLRPHHLPLLVLILTEQRNTKRPEQVKGRNRQGCPVFFVGDIDELKGKLVPVRIVEALAYSLVGELERNRFAGGKYVDAGGGEGGGTVVDTVGA